MNRLISCAAWWKTMLVLAATVLLPASHGSSQQAESVDVSAAPDTVRYLLEPLVVGVERERASPAPVAAITVDVAQLRASQGGSPYELLRRVTGIEVHDQGQGPGFASNVVMRGFTSDHSADVLLVIDGVPVNLPVHGHVEGYADWNVLFPQAVSSMRVIPGNASPLYGDFALAGVVEVFTRADAEGSSVSLRGSSFGDLGGALTTGRRGEAGGVLGGFDFRRQDGWRANSDYMLGNVLLRGWREILGVRAEGGASLYATEWNSPGFVSVSQFNDRELQNVSDETDGGDSRRAMVHGRTSLPLGSDSFLQLVGWGTVSDYSLFLHIPGHNHGGGPGPLLQSGEWDKRWGAGGHVEYGHVFSNGDLLLGVSGRADNAQYSHAATLQRRPVNLEIDLQARHRAAALYGRWRVETAARRLGIDLGVRLDVLRHASLSRLDGGSGVGWTEANTAVFAPKLGARLRVRDGLIANLSSSRGFRSPVGIVGDPSRKPYLAWSHELGLEWTFGESRLSGSLFRADVRNERIQDPLTFEISSAGTSRRQGVELGFATRSRSGLVVEGGATWNHARLSGMYADAHADHPHEVFDSGIPSMGSLDLEVDGWNEVPGVAQYLGFLRANAPLPLGLAAESRWRFAGPHIPIGEMGVRTRPYSVLDLGLSASLGEGRTVTVELENVVGIRYVELRSSGYVTPGAPRSLRIQMEIDRFRY